MAWPVGARVGGVGCMGLQGQPIRCAVHTHTRLHAKRNDISTLNRTACLGMHTQDMPMSKTSYVACRGTGLTRTPSSQYTCTSAPPTAASSLRACGTTEAAHITHATQAPRRPSAPHEAIFHTTLTPVAQSSCVCGWPCSTPYVVTAEGGGTPASAGRGTGGSTCLRWSHVLRHACCAGCIVHRNDVLQEGGAWKVLGHAGRSLSNATYNRSMRWLHTHAMDCVLTRSRCIGGASPTWCCWTAMG